MSTVKDKLVSLEAKSNGGKHETPEEFNKRKKSEVKAHMKAKKYVCTFALPSCVYVFVGGCVWLRENLYISTHSLSLNASRLLFIHKIIYLSISFSCAAVNPPLRAVKKAASSFNLTLRAGELKAAKLAELRRQEDMRQCKEAKEAAQQYQMTGRAMKLAMTGVPMGSEGECTLFSLIAYHEHPTNIS